MLMIEMTEPFLIINLLLAFLFVSLTVWVIKSLKGNLSKGNVFILAFINFILVAKGVICFICYLNEHD